MKSADSPSGHHPLDFDRDGAVSVTELVAGALLGLGVLGLGFVAGMLFYACTGV